MERVIALDPGETTGWAIYQEDMPEAVSKFTCGQLGPADHHDELDRLLGMFHAHNYTIVCERFEYRNNSRAGLNLMSREYIGVAKRFAQERNVPIVMQNASQAKGFVKDRHLRTLGLWAPKHEDRHSMDAYRHLIYYLTSNRSDYPIGSKLLEVGWK